MDFLARQEQIKKLREEGWTYQLIAGEFGLSKQRIYQIVTSSHLQTYGPKIIISPSMPGLPPNDPLIGQLSRAGFEHLQGRDVTREAVRRRDKYRCQKCKKVWCGTERRFDVHHLGGACGKKSKGYDKIEDATELITLCHHCHMNLHEVRQKMLLSYRRENGVDNSKNPNENGT